MEYSKFAEIALSIIKNLIYDYCLVFEETKLYEILNKFNISFNEDIAVLKKFINNEFRRYENGN